jgi:hypothetical protein
MIAELKSFHAVLCKRCNEPIPVPLKVLTLQKEIEQGDSNAPCAFPLRCRLCEQENVYQLIEIQRVAGEPPQRMMRARAALFRTA